MKYPFCQCEQKSEVKYIIFSAPTFPLCEPLVCIFTKTPTGISSGASLLKQKFNLTVVEQFELKEQTMDSDIDTFLEENMEHIGRPKIFVAICKLTCLRSLLYQVTF